jgi:hypothetical protein
LLLAIAAALLTFGCGDSPAEDSASSIRSFSFSPARNPGLTAAVTATIEGTTVTARVPFGTAVTALVATFTATAPDVTVGGTAQVSGTTPNDFTGPLVYRVVAADGSTTDYTVTVTVAASSAKELTALSFRSLHNPGLLTDVSATITGTEVTATVPAGTQVSALVATYAAMGASVTVGGVVQASEATANDFTGPVVYRVIAVDGSATSYTVTVTVATSSAKELTALSFRSANNPGLAADVTATITGTTITATVPVGTAVAALVATFESTGTRVTVDGASQTSGATANNFTSAVVYRVVAADSSTQDYIVVVTARAQQAYVKASNTRAGALFGRSVALSADGTTLAVGAVLESSGQLNSGAVYVFTRAGATWVQQAFLKASNAGAGDGFGESVALSADGSTLAVGADLEDSAATGVGGNQASNDGTDSGAVYVFTRAGATWTQQAYVKASNTGAIDEFGGSVALSADGATLAVGAILEDGAATGVNGEQRDTSAIRDASGAVYVFTRAGVTWTQQAYVKASNTGASDHFGVSVALAGDGSTLAVGAFREDSAATGVDGDQAANSAAESGAVYVFTRAGTRWTQQAYVKASNTGADDGFGQNIALSANGSTLAVGAIFEASAAAGVGGDQTDNTAIASGAVYVFVFSDARWTHQTYAKASNPETFDELGISVALSGDGATLAAGALNERSSAIGVDGDQANNNAPGSGAVYVFR